MNRILITGGTGFLGRNIVKSLISQNVEVVVLTNKQRTLAIGPNLQSYPAEKINKLGKKFDQVIHLATNYTKKTDSESILNTISCNIDFSMNVIELARRHESHLVITSSYMQYETQKRPNVYVESKRITSELANAYANEGKLKLSEIVMHDTYGPYDSRKKIVKILLEANRNSSPIELGNPNQYINLSHIDDVVAIIGEELSTRSEGKIEIKGPDDVRIENIPKIIDDIYHNREVPIWKYLKPTSHETLFSTLRIGRMNLIDGLRNIIESEYR